jgi:Carboxypeptidase regulatory-like domain
MKTILRSAIHAFVVLTASALTVADATADVCVYRPPKVRRICGTVLDSSGRPIPNVNVTVLKGGTALKNVVTDETGEFDLDVTRPGKYELDVMASGFQHGRYQLTVSKPGNSCNRALRIEMITGGLHCGGDIRLTKKPISKVGQ